MYYTNLTYDNLWRIGSSPPRPGWWIFRWRTCFWQLQSSQLLAKLTSLESISSVAGNWEVMCLHHSMFQNQEWIIFSICMLCQACVLFVKEESCGKMTRHKKPSGVYRNAQKYGSHGKSFKHHIWNHVFLANSTKIPCIYDRFSQLLHIQKWTIPVSLNLHWRHPCFWFLRWRPFSHHKVGYWEKVVLAVHCVSRKRAIRGKSLTCNRKRMDRFGKCRRERLFSAFYHREPQ